MRASLKPTEDIEQLKQNLEKRVESIEEDSGKLLVKVESYNWLEKVPGIEEIQLDEETIDGIGGSPVSEQAYIRIDSRHDAVKAFLATMKGYDLRILNSGREWDLRRLRRYNPDIKHLKFDEPKEILDIEKSVGEIEDMEKVDLEVPDEESSLEIYRRFLT